MPFFTRAVWPGDHRDEIVAGALVGAVVVVLGYASGIGGTRAADARAAVTPPAPPTAGAPPSPGPPEDSPTPSAEPPAAPAPGAQAPGAGDPAALPPSVPLPVDDGGGHVQGTPGDGGADHGAGNGHPEPPGSAPSPSPSAPDDGRPGDDEPCTDGSVHLVEPLLKQVTAPVFGVLDLLSGQGAEAPPEAPATPSEAPSGPSAGKPAEKPAGQLADPLGGCRLPEPSATSSSSSSSPGTS
ncbi:hypothetical protein [Streptomyces sp. NPDC019937]|uniref:hypothetical protein n=1 Tax=Streptomyces sp. NPDC019937 TaxID=3154787 RepID=UPI0033C67C7A